MEVGSSEPGRWPNAVCFLCNATAQPQTQQRGVHSGGCIQGIDIMHCDKKLALFQHKHISSQLMLYGAIEYTWPTMLNGMCVVRLPDILIVRPACSVPLRGVHGALIPWFIEVWLVHKDKRLDKDQHLQQQTHSVLQNLGTLHLLQVKLLHAHSVAAACAS